ncbi:MAG: DUF5335 family protein [Rhodothermales bacterium]
MSVKKLEKRVWKSYFNSLSKPYMHKERTDYAEIRVFSNDIGAQPETQWLPLEGITYDDRDDLLEVMVEHLDHLVFHPEEIYVDETTDGHVMTLEIVRKDGVKEIIELR